MESNLTTDFGKLTIGKEYYLHQNVTEYMGTFSHMVENKNNGFMVFIRAGRAQCVDMSLINNISESFILTQKNTDIELILNYNDVYCAGL